MDVVQHEHIAIQFQPFILQTIRHRLSQNLPAVVPIKEVISALYRQRQVIRSGI
jgi:hypothetical protein